MRIGLDLTHCYQRNGGIQRYAIELTRALLETDHENEYILFFRGEIRQELAGFPVESYVSPIKHQVLCEQTWLWWMAQRNKLDLLHLTGFAGPVFYSGRSVCTVADVTPFLFRETVKFSQAVYWRWLMPLSARRCNRIITISESSKQDISRVLKVEDNKISVTYLAVSPVFGVIKEEKQFDKVQRKYNLPKDFVLMVGTLEPRKNHLMVVRAFIEAAATVPELHLVLAGRPGWLYQPLLKMIAQRGLTERVRFLGSVSDEELVVLYNMARFLAYPSLYEGFGLPILEAMSCGCPVLTSNVSSMPEIAGDAALLVSPTDSNEINSAFLQMLNRDFADHLSEKGLKRANSFSWKLAALGTLENYRLAIGRKIS